MTYPLLSSFRWVAAPKSRVQLISDCIALRGISHHCFSSRFGVITFGQTRDRGWAAIPLHAAILTLMLMFPLLSSFRYYMTAVKSSVGIISHCIALRGTSHHNVSSRSGFQFNVRTETAACETGPGVGSRRCDACTVPGGCRHDCRLHSDRVAGAARDGDLRLVEGDSGPGYEYGRLEIFLRGFWSTICDTDGFTPDSAAVACKMLGYGGGAALKFKVPYSQNFPPDESQVR